MRAEVSPEAVALFLRLEAISRRQRETWEPAGRRREYPDGKMRLCKLCPPLFWGDCISPVDVTGPTPPYGEHRAPQAAAWAVAWRWRCALLEAAGFVGERAEARPRLKKKPGQKGQPG